MDKIIYIPDTPIDLEKYDILGTKIYVECIEKIIETCLTPYTIGLFGSWGSGKSSIVRTLQEKINKGNNKNYKVFIYDAWKYSNDDFRRTFILELRKYFGLDIKEEEEIFYKDKTSDIAIKPIIDKNFFIIFLVTTFLFFSIGYFWLKSKLLETLIGSSSLGGLFSFVFSILRQGIIYYRTTITTSRLFAPEQFENKFKETINEIKKKTKLNKFIIAIDNMDRCQKEQLFEILQSIKNFLEIQNVVFIIPIDDNSLRKYLNMPTYETNEFIRKIFNTTICVKPYSSNELYDYALKLFENYGINIPKKEIVLSLITQEFSKNPRKIIQFINIFQTEFYLAQKQEEHELIPKSVVTGHPEMFTKLLIIREEYPELYNKLIDDKSFLNDITCFVKKEKFEEYEKGNKFNYNGFEITQDLYRFLLRTSNVLLDSQSMESFFVTKDLFKNIPDDIYYEVLNQEWTNLKERINKKEIKLESLLNFIDKICDEEVIRRQLYETTGYNLASLMFKLINDEKEKINPPLPQNILALFERKEIWNNTYNYSQEELCISLKWLKETHNFEIDNVINKINSLELEKLENKHLNLIKTYINIFEREDLIKISKKFSEIISKNFTLYNTKFKEELNSEKIKYLLTDNFAKSIIPTLQRDYNQNNTKEKIDLLKSLYTYNVLSKNTIEILCDKVIENIGIINQYWDYDLFSFWIDKICDFLTKACLDKIYQNLPSNYTLIYQFYQQRQFQEQYIEAYKVLAKLIGELFLKVELIEKDLKKMEDLANKLQNFFNYQINPDIASFINDVILQNRIIPKTQSAMFLQMLITNFIQQSNFEMKNKLFNTIKTMLVKKDIDFSEYQNQIGDIVNHIINIENTTAEKWLIELTVNPICLNEIVNKILSLEMVALLKKLNLIKMLLEKTRDNIERQMIIKSRLFDTIKEHLASTKTEEIELGINLLYELSDNITNLLHDDEKELIKNLLKNISYSLQEEIQMKKNELLNRFIKPKEKS